MKVWSSAELQQKYGDVLPLLAEENSSPYKLCKALKTRTPPVYVTDAIAKEWFKYHPVSGPRRIVSADALEKLMGDEMRRRYAYLPFKKIMTRLSRRRKPVLVNEKSVRTWIEKYSRQAPVRRRRAGGMKRPAAAADETPDDRLRVSPSSDLASSQSMSSVCEAAEAVEQTVGDRLRVSPRVYLVSSQSVSSVCEVRIPLWYLSEKPMSEDALRYLWARIRGERPST